MADRGMGRGLAAILSAPEREDATEELRVLPVDAIEPNPNQPRRHFDEDSLGALATSLRERGVLQPVLVRPRPAGGWELIAGERRWRAAQLAGLDEVPAIVRADDDAASLELALIENMAREDLNPVEQARACAALVEELGLTREDVGRRVGRSRVAVSNLVRLLDLPDEGIELLETGALTAGHGRALLLAEDHGDRRRLARAAADGGWSVRQTEDRARAANGATPARSRRAPRPHPDQEAAMATASEALGAALGRDVTVRQRGTGYRIEVELGSVDEALELAARIAPRTGD
ncbi:MAG: ParB family transcriptional regulator, chromosome partitioning protein [Solirubrobacteraceae bacterium]|nr:ParB family transcriptional regulator, chromosome partitioning protein [Solirubrobacteraceae bacterium]